MNALSAPRLRPTTLQSIDLALAEVAQGQTTNADVKPRLEAASKDIEGYGTHTRAIEFDRPDRDVSEHGRALRAQADGAWAENDVAQQDLVSISGNAERIKQHLADALASCPANKPKAREWLESAGPDLERLQQRTLRDLQTTVRLSEKAIRTELSPYLTEVEEDSPGRDVGRFADDLNHWLGEASTGFRLGAKQSVWVDDDFGQLVRRLQWAKKNL